MCCCRFTISASYRKAVERYVQTAQHLGQLRQTKYFLAIRAVSAGQSVAQVAWVLRVHEQTAMTWLRECCCSGCQGAPHRTPTGRPPTLPPPHTAALVTWIEAGPVNAGCRGACWRSPMMPQWIDDRFGVLSTGFYSAQWRKNLGWSSQKAACVSAPLDEDKRHAGRLTTWPPMLRWAKERQALWLCGDAARCPQWGTLTYTWARRGQQPQGKTSGQRKGYKGFGLMESFTGCCFSPGQEGRLNATADVAFLPRVLEHTTQPLLLMQDGARSQTSAETTAFFAQQAARLQVFPLPTSSPDDNPIETLGKKITQQETHLHYCPTCEALTDKVAQALLKCANIPEEMLALCSLPTEFAQAAEVGCVEQSFS